MALIMLILMPTTQKVHLYPYWNVHNIHIIEITGTICQPLSGISHTKWLLFTELNVDRDTMNVVNDMIIYRDCRNLSKCFPLMMNMNSRDLATETCIQEGWLQTTSLNMDVSFWYTRLNPKYITRLTFKSYLFLRQNYTFLH